MTFFSLCSDSRTFGSGTCHLLNIDLLRLATPFFFSGVRLCMAQVQHLCDATTYIQRYAQNVVKLDNVVWILYLKGFGITWPRGLPLERLGHEEKQDYKG